MSRNKPRELSERGPEVGLYAPSRADLKRQRIIEVASKVFSANGGNPTSFESVAAAAGVTRTALYYYFPTKADLVRAVLTRTVDWNWWELAIEAGRGRTDFSERLRLLLFECLARSVQSPGDVYYALLEASRADPEVRAGLRSYTSELHRAIHALVVDCKAQGSLPENTDISAVTDGVVGLIWCVASGLAHTTSKTVISQVKNAIEVVSGNLSGGGWPVSHDAQH
jgi:AcrR family transcriptional regulator